MRHSTPDDLVIFAEIIQIATTHAYQLRSISIECSDGDDPQVWDVIGDVMIAALPAISLKLSKLSNSCDLGYTMTSETNGVCNIAITIGGPPFDEHFLCNKILARIDGDSNWSSSVGYGLYHMAEYIRRRSCTVSTLKS